MTTEELFVKFKEAYQKSILEYENLDGRNFLLNVRPTLDKMCLWLISAILQNESLLADLQEGTKNIVNEASTSYRSQVVALTPSPNYIPNWRYFLIHSIFYKNNYCFNTRIQPNNYREKLAIEAVINPLNEVYKLACELEQHVNLLERRDTIIQVQKIPGIFCKFLDDIQAYIPNDAQIYLKQLPQWDEEVFLKNKFYLRETFSEICSKLNQGNLRYFILLPTSTALSNHDIEALQKMQGSLIVDFSVGDVQKANEILISQQKTIKILDPQNLSVSDSLYNWFFANGRERDEVPANCFQEWYRKNKRKKLRPIIERFVEAGLYEFCILNFLDEEGYFSAFLDLLEDPFGDWDAVSRRCNKIYTFSNNGKVREEGSQWAQKIDYNKHSCFNSSIHDLFDAIYEVKAEHVVNPRISKESILSKIETDEFRIYRDYGIEIFGSNKLIKSEYGYYAGEDISFEELASHFDADRDKYVTYLEQMCNTVKRQQGKVIEYDVYHQPGAGGTTLTRRVAFDLLKKTEEVDAFVCLPIFVSSYHPLKTKELLYELSDKINNAFLCITIEEDFVNSENIQKIKEELTSKQRSAILQLVKRKANVDFQGRLDEYSIRLSGVLSDVEKKQFNQRYGFPFNEEELNQTKEVIEFPLKKHETSLHDLNNYVRVFTDQLPDLLKTFVAYSAFVSKYCKRPLNHILIDGVSEILEVLDDDAMVSLNKLLVRVIDGDGRLTNEWRPRFSAFEEPILSTVWANYDSMLPDISQHFLFECSKAGNLGTSIEVLHNLFVERSDVNFKEQDSENKDRFAPVIEAILQKHQLPEPIFERLINDYPQDPIFKGHFARFLYEKAHDAKVSHDDVLFERAANLLDEAIEDNEVEDLYHMRGMLYRRKISVISKKWAEVCRVDGCDFTYWEELVQTYLIQGERAFEESIKINLASAHGYSAICFLYEEAFQLIKRIKAESSYEFVGNNDFYLEISLKFKDYLDQFASLCSSIVIEKDRHIPKAVGFYNHAFKFYIEFLGGKENLTYYADNFLTKYYNGNEGVDYKLLQGSNYMDCVLCAKQDKEKDPRKKHNTYYLMKELSTKERGHFEKILCNQRDHGSAQSCDKLFTLRMSSKDEYPIDEAINDLQAWLDIYRKSGVQDYYLLKVWTYLGACYAAKALLSKTIDQYSVDKASECFKNSGALAEKFEKPNLPLLWFDIDENDVHCLSFERDRATIIEEACYISNQRDKRGAWAKYKGLPLYFPLYKKGDLSVADENKTLLTGRIGVRYAGLGLYFESEDETKEVAKRTTFDPRKHGALLADEDDLIENNSHTKRVDELKKGVYERKTDRVWVSNSRYYPVLSKKEELYDGADVSFELQQDDTRSNRFVAINVEIIG